MGTVNDTFVVKMNGNLRFDPIREDYIIEKLDWLRSHNKLSNYINTLLRLSFETPELLNQNVELLEKLQSYGVSPCAKEFFDEKSKEVTEMHRKVDAIYQMCSEMYTLVKFGKALGLDRKVESTARAEFMLERQITDMCRTLGIADRNTFQSVKIPNVEEQAAKSLEYIITHYDGIVQEIKADMSPVSIPVAYQFDNTPKVEVPKAVEQVADKADDEDEYIDFGVEAAKTFDDTADVGGILDMFDFA